MKKTIILGICLFEMTVLKAQTIINRDPVIARMVNDISAERLEQHVRTLAGFHTRHNLSTQTDPSKGIGAAWNWIKAEMEKNIPASGGRLEVKFEDYTVGGKGQRINRPVNLKNVVGILRGTDSSDDRKIIISAHFDSRVQLDNDSTSYAP
ncbi:MAG: hypothetical protein MUE74_13355, partial [Bacteroidales bacterium]|nr:hypothetical protein [Bacteroidales bacterium]